MRGDFTRLTFDPYKHFSRVLLQQGRPLLDADANENMAIILHYLRTMVKDLLGPFWRVGDGFALSTMEDARYLAIGRGHCYVDGILCENDLPMVCGVCDGDEPPLSYAQQPHYFPESELFTPGRYFAYLDVWERHISHLQDSSIREVALGGPDTTTRTQVVWQVKVASMASEPTDDPCAELNEMWPTWIEQRQPCNRGCLAARVNGANGTNEVNGSDPCQIAPERRYRGVENQLYRVEIHTGGAADTATFKYSRDNGSIAVAIRKLSGNIITVEHLGRDERTRLEPGDWVEIIDDRQELHGVPGQLFRIESVDATEMSVTLSGQPGVMYDEKSTTHPLLRRWDHRAGDPERGGLAIAADGALPVVENRWITLEDGIQIWFQGASELSIPSYRTGDYWLIPARTITGSIEWPRNEAGNPATLPPHGVEHHYAQLGTFRVIEGNQITDTKNCESGAEIRIAPRRG